MAWLGASLDVASRAAAGAFLDYELAWLKESLGRGDREPEQWRHTTKIMGVSAWVTASESREIAAEVQKTLDRYAGRGKEPAERPGGAREVRLFAAVTLAPSSPPGRE